MENHKSKSGEYINIEIRVPIEMININKVVIEGDYEDGFDTSHDEIIIDDCDFEILDYDENEINQLAFERWENE